MMSSVVLVRILTIVVLQAAPKVIQVCVCLHLSRLCVLGLAFVTSGVTSIVTFEEKVVVQSLGKRLRLSMLLIVNTTGLPGCLTSIVSLVGMNRNGSTRSSGCTASG